MQVKNFVLHCPENSIILFVCLFFLLYQVLYVEALDYFSRRQIIGAVGRAEPALSLSMYQFKH